MKVLLVSSGFTGWFLRKSQCLQSSQVYSPAFRSGYSVFLSYVLILPKQIVQSLSQHLANGAAQLDCWIIFPLLDGVHGLAGNSHCLGERFLCHIQLSPCDLDLDITCNIDHPLIRILLYILIYVKYIRLFEQKIWKHSLNQLRWRYTGCRVPEKLLCVVAGLPHITAQPYHSASKPSSTAGTKSHSSEGRGKCNLGREMSGCLTAYRR